MLEIEKMQKIVFKYRKAVNQGLKKFDLTIDQYNLTNLARKHGPITLTQASKVLFLDKATLSLISQKCLTKELLTKKLTKKDKRSFFLLLSGLGEETLDRIEKEHVLKHFTEEKNIDLEKIFINSDFDEIKIFSLVLEKIDKSYFMNF